MDRIYCPSCQSQNVKPVGGMYATNKHDLRCRDCNVRFIITNPSYLSTCKEKTGNMKYRSKKIFEYIVVGSFGTMSSLKPGARCFDRFKGKGVQSWVFMNINTGKEVGSFTAAYLGPADEEHQQSVNAKWQEHFERRKREPQGTPGRPLECSPIFPVES